MGRHEEWLDALPGRPVFVGYPAAFDFLPCADPSWVQNA
jgi:hypothetical protein